jgi:hypothetical protein
MNEKNQTPGIHAKAEDCLYDFPDEERRIVHKLSQEWFVTKVGGLSINESQYRYALIKATQRYREMFGLERELIVVFSGYEVFQARSIDTIDKLLESVLEKQESLRVERICSILFSKDINIEGKIGRILKESQVESQVVIPISYDEILKTKGNGDEYFLINKFKNHFYGRDLFDFTSPLRKDVFFFGRTNLINKLGNRHFSSENSSIFGLRRSGKTSLVLAVQRHMDRVQCPSVFIACDNTSFQQRRWNECLHYILKELVDKYNNKVSPKKDLSPLEDYTERDAALVFEKDLRCIYGKLGRKSILFIFDEIERITFNTALLEHWQEGDDFILFWQTLKSVFNASTKIFSYLIVGTNPACIEAPKIAGKDNPIFQSVSIEYLDRFEVEQTRDMVGKLGNFMGLDFEEQIYSKLTEDYGGHPFLIRQACSFIYQRSKSSLPIRIDRAMYLRVKEEFEKTKARGYIKLILEVLTDFYPEEHTMLNLLATGDKDFFNRLANDSPEYVTHLVGYGIISENYSKDGYDFRIDAVQKYLQDSNKYKTLNLSVNEMRQEISQRRIDLELKLRDVVRTQILGRYGVRNASNVVWNILKSDSANSKKKLENFKYRDLFDPAKINIYFDGLRKMIVTEWGIFEEIFENEKQLDQVMQSINIYRRIDAHSGDINNTQFTDFRVNMEWIETRLIEWKKQTG